MLTHSAPRRLHPQKLQCRKWKVEVEQELEVKKEVELEVEP